MHIPFGKDRLLAEIEACLLTRKFAKERVPDVITPLNSHSSCVCRYQVAQMLERQKVQRIAFERMALSSQCLSRHGCILRHQRHHTDALLILDMCGDYTRSAAQPQVWSRKITTAAEACKIPVWGVSELQSHIPVVLRIQRRSTRIYTPCAWKIV